MPLDVKRNAVKEIKVDIAVSASMCKLIMRICICADM